MELFFFYAREKTCSACLFLVMIIAGAVLLGPVGAVAGIGGKKHKSYTWRCKECGYTKTYVD